MTTTTSTANTSPSWRESNDSGRRAFLQSNYSQALFHYSEAIDQLISSSSSSSEAAEERRRVDDREGSRTTNTTTSAATADATTTTNGDGGSNIRDNGGNQHQFQYEHQILLSNVIACRLKIGGNEMAQKAVEDAKQVKHHIIIVVLVSTFPHLR
jgi:hypothetical protein